MGTRQPSPFVANAVGLASWRQRVQDKAMRQLERAEQIAVFRWAQAQECKHPELCLLHAVPNGGKRHIVAGHFMKLSGMKRGIPDIHLPVARHGYCGLWIEMKYGKNKVQEHQGAIIEKLIEYGNSVHVCYNAEDAIKVIKWYLSK